MCQVNCWLVNRDPYKMAIPILIMVFPNLSFLPSCLIRTFSGVKRHTEAQLRVGLDVGCRGVGLRTSI